MNGSDGTRTVIRGLKTVCRCNNIKYRTIERAIREGAYTVAEVAARTGATTGHCGGTCTPDVLAMILELAPEHVATPPLPGEHPHTAAANSSAWWVRKK